MKSLGLGALAGAAMMLLAGGASSTGGEKAWEYRIVPGKPSGGELERAINASGAEGWDFVTVSDRSLEAFAFAVLRKPR